ncbi:hypothetical protein [Ferrovum sp.]|uniref:hypothetical protein n=1 Tax=Ferrovum sp. TaxID=2609467 RepID=UPI002615223C|nr:hypothetical protein [Ferrovum sp.]
MSTLATVNRDAHIHYLHPNRLPWREAVDDEERDFLSRALVGAQGQEAKAVAYLYKELSQLAELEMHVSAVLVRVLCELQGEPAAPYGEGSELYHALSCFAAEEINHANTFYRYVRELSGRDIKLTDNLFKERIGLFAKDDSPMVKLAALCATAYVGESLITVFERRIKMLDPEQRFFFTKLLHYHGLDEARHIQSDHFVFDHIIPNLSSSERIRMHELIDATEALNTELAIRSAAQIKTAFGTDYSSDNHSAAVQLKLATAFRRIVQSGDLVVKVDNGLDPETAAEIADFSGLQRVHN